METITIEMPSRIKNTNTTYCFLCDLYNELLPIKSGKIILNFAKTGWIDANLCSPLGAILEAIKANSNQILISSPQEPIRKFFINSFFVSKFRGLEKQLSSQIEYKLIKSNDYKTFGKYIDKNINQVMKKNGMAKNIARLNKVISEIFINVDMHTSSDSIFFAGTYYHRTNTFLLSITNIGETIPAVLLKNNIMFSADKDAIQWALIKNNSTSKEKRTKGLGLYELSEFTKSVNGIVEIRSGKGLLRITKSGYITLQDCGYSFPGTTFCLRYDTSKHPDIISNKTTKLLTIEEILSWR